MALAALWLAYEALSWPRVSALATTNPESWSTLERARARGLVAEHRWAPYDQISQELKRAVLVAEDIGFFSHSGFETTEIRQAIEDTLVEGRRLRGASTITQQLAKNLWLSGARSPLRKAKEAILTVQLERSLSKRRILELYLNVVEFAPGVVGAAAAAGHYYGVPPAALGRERAAALAASLPASTWFPGCSSRRYDAHRRRILARIPDAGWLDRHL